MRLDFKHFQRYVTFSTEEPEGWRGEIREGEVVRSHEDAMADEENEDDEEAQEDAEDEEAPEGGAEDDEEPEDDADDEPEEDDQEE